MLFELWLKASQRRGGQGVTANRVSKPKGANTNKTSHDLDLQERAFQAYHATQSGHVRLVTRRITKRNAQTESTSGTSVCTPSFSSSFSSSLLACFTNFLSLSAFSIEKFWRWIVRREEQRGKEYIYSNRRRWYSTKRNDRGGSFAIASIRARSRNTHRFVEHWRWLHRR